MKLALNRGGDSDSFVFEERATGITVGALGIVAADFDDDGDVDFLNSELVDLLLNPSTDEIEMTLALTVLENDGDGNFSEGTRSEIEIIPASGAQFFDGSVSSRTLPCWRQGI